MSALDRRISNIETQLSYIITMISKDKTFTGYDIEAGRINTSRAQKTADDANEYAQNNKQEINTTQDALIETFEATVENSTNIAEVEDALMEVYELVIGMEG